MPPSRAKRPAHPPHRAKRAADRPGRTTWLSLPTHAVANKVCFIEFIPQAELGGGAATGIEIDHDARGNIEADAQFDYTFDEFDRIIKIVDRSYDPLAPAHPIPHTARYVYDAAGRRVAMLYSGQDDDGTAIDPWPDEVITYSSVAAIEVGRYGAAAPNVMRRRFYEGPINKLALVEEDLNGDGDPDDTTDYAFIPLTDDRGTVMGVATGKDGFVDGTYYVAGAVMEKLYYNSTGLIQAYDSSGQLQAADPYRSRYLRFGWCGMSRSPFTGLYHTHYRDYAPLHARWLSEDPAGYNDGLNLYANYAGVNSIDPLGLGKLITERKLMRIPGKIPYWYVTIFEKCGGDNDPRMTLRREFRLPYSGGARQYAGFAQAEEYVNQLLSNRVAALVKVEDGAKVLEVYGELAIRLSPISDFYEFVTGNDIMTGDDLAWWEQTLAGAGIIVKGGSIAITAKQAGELLNALAAARKIKYAVSGKALKSVTDMKSLQKVMKTAAEAADQAADARRAAKASLTKADDAVRVAKAPKSKFYHSTSDAAVKPIMDNGFRTDIPNPQAAFHNNRFGRGVYLSDSPAAALAERPGGVVLSVDANVGRNLNIVGRGPIDSHRMGKAIGRGARKHGFDSITTQSVQPGGGINTIILDPAKARATGIVR